MTGRATGSATVIAAIVGSALLSVAVPAYAAGPTFTVDSILDQPDDLTSPGTCHTAANTCTLRAAIMQANRTSGAGATIVVPASVNPYLLTIPAVGGGSESNGDLDLTTPAVGNPTITIVGADAATTIIDANQLDRVLLVEAGRSASISGVTIRNGFREGASGGGVSNSGTLTITDCVIEDNQTNAAGGGIYSPGTLHITRSTIRSNLAFLGGGFWLHGIATVRDSTLYGNGASGDGGAIEVSAFNSDSQLNIVNSTISLNFANTNGGGISSEGDTFLYNVSVIDNDADHDRDEYGGIGGGVWVNPGSRFVVVNTLIARNTVLDSPIDDDCNGVLESYGWNLLGIPDRCTFSGNGEDSRGVISLDAFGPLQDNGGPTLTHALSAGSVAIDAAYVQGCVDENGAPLTADQRGAPRGLGADCDIGAFEVPEPGAGAAAAVAIAMLASLRSVRRRS